MDDEYLMLSGIQHFAICPKQWALIHVEQQWKETCVCLAPRGASGLKYDGHTVGADEDVSPRVGRVD